LQVKDILSTNATVQIHKGNSNIWNTPWCQIWETIHSILNILVTVTPLPLSVNQLWNHLSQTWNVDLINQLFSPQAAHAITTTDIIPSTDNDTIIWRLAPNGLCTGKMPSPF
jgi:allophanate hydrolase subunit 1